MRLYTPRLCLRSLCLADAARIRELCGDKRIAEMTARIPHPYPEGEAEKWIASLESFTDSAREVVFGITLAGTRTPGRELDPAETGHLIGVIGITFSEDAEHARGEIGYWMGAAYWGRGFATEAGHAFLAYLFMRRNLHRVTGSHFAVNPASGRVMEKLGMTREGILREHFYRDGVFHDVVSYAILREEWERSAKKPARPEFLRKGRSEAMSAA